MEFFVENWLWFLVGGIVILMTIIGYIAEKTDFGRKDIQKKEKSEKKKEKTLDKVEVIEPEVTEEFVPTEEKEVEPEVQIALATDSFLEEPETLEIESQNDNQNSEEIPEELKVPFGDISFEEPVDNVTNNFNTNDSFVDEVIEEEPQEVIQTEAIETPEIELPDLESIVSDSNDEDDDVWKF